MGPIYKNGTIRISGVFLSKMFLFDLEFIFQYQNYQMVNHKLDSRKSEKFEFRKIFLAILLSDESWPENIIKIKVSRASFKQINV